MCHRFYILAGTNMELNDAGISTVMDGMVKGKQRAKL